MKSTKNRRGKEVGDNWGVAQEIEQNAENCQEKVAKPSHVLQLFYDIFISQKTTFKVKKSHREFSAIFMFLSYTKLYRICIEHSLQLFFYSGRICGNFVQLLPYSLTHYSYFKNY